MIVRPPIVVQGSKIDIFPHIKEYTNEFPYKRWVEPFMGSGAVALNLKPKYALMTDTNKHIIRLYQDIQDGVINSRDMKDFFLESKKELEEKGPDFFYKTREEFNKNPNSFLFMLLNKLSFNQLMRFNAKGYYNTSFCRDTGILRESLIEYLASIIDNVRQIIDNWEFKCQSYEFTLQELKGMDFVYMDPPYSGLHTTYYNKWTVEDSKNMFLKVIDKDFPFLLSLWYSYRERTNNLIDEFFSNNDVIKINHYYKVGGTSSRRISQAKEVIIIGNENERHRMLRRSLRKI